MTECYYCAHDWLKYPAVLSDLSHAETAENCQFHGKYIVTVCDYCKLACLSDARGECIACYQKLHRHPLSTQISKGSPNRRVILASYGLENFEG